MGRSRLERRSATRPKPQTNRTSRPSSTATASEVRQNHRMRACLTVGGGKLMTVWVSNSTLAEFFGFLGRGAHGAHECGADFAFFQFMQAFDGRTARAGAPV